MAQNILKEFNKNGFVKIKNVLDYKLDLEPVLNDITFIMKAISFKIGSKSDL